MTIDFHRRSTGLHRAMQAVCLMAMTVAFPAQTFEPAVPSAEEIFMFSKIAVVVGRFTSSDADPAVFIVEESLRGQVPPGRYTVFERGRFGSRGETAVFAMSRPSGDSAQDRVLLPVERADHTKAQLIVPMAVGWRFRVANGMVHDRMGFTARFHPLVQALRNGRAHPLWNPVKP